MNKRTAHRWVARCLAAAVWASTLAAGPVRADGDGPHGKLEGTWRVEVTTADCQTGTPGLRFDALLSFARGGTLSGTTANPVFRPGQRTSDYGVWRKTGDHTYRAVSEAFILFDSPAAPPAPPLARGVQRITQAIDVAGDTFDSRAAVRFFDVNGQVLGTLCASATGERMQ
jgi:hypothetical protein